MKAEDIKDSINNAAPDKLKPLHVSEVPFHPFAKNAANDAYIPY